MPRPRFYSTVQGAFSALNSVELPSAEAWYMVQHAVRSSVDFESWTEAIFKFPTEGLFDYWRVTAHSDGTYTDYAQETGNDIADLIEYMRDLPNDSFTLVITGSEADNIRTLWT